MKKEAQSKKEIYIVLLAFLLVALLTLISKFFGFYQIETMHKIISNIYEHPLKVSNASLLVALDVYEMHRDMKDIVLSESQKEYLKRIEEVNDDEKRVYKNLAIIEKNILGEEGLELQRETLKLFHDWKPIRDEVIALVKNNKVYEAISITKGEGYYTVGRISKYIYRNEHLSGVFAVIRDVNQLIVREKEVEKMLQESCNILTSNHVYGQAWVMIFNDDHQVEHIIGSDSSENFEAFKEKVKNLVLDD
jgi:hypothetical protein